MAEFFHTKGMKTALVTDCLHQMFPGMNFHRGFHAWQWVRGQEWDLMKLESTIRKNADPTEFITEKTSSDNPKAWEISRNFINTSTRENEQDYFAPQVFAKAGQFLEQHYKNTEKDLFLCVDSFDPHEPWDPPQYYRDLYADPAYKGKKIFMPMYTADRKGYISDDELKYMRACYAAEITMVDQWFGGFMDKIRIMGLDKNSVICVVSDHGHQLGENDYTGKMPSGMLPCLMDLVFMIHHPSGLGAGQECDAIVQNHDILPTVCDMMGFDIPDYAEGISILPVLEGKKDKIRDYATSIFKDYVWVRTDEFMLIRRQDLEEPRLYNIINDPSCSNNIAAENMDKVAELWQLALNDAGGEIPKVESFSTLLGDNSPKK